MDLIDIGLFAPLSFVAISRRINFLRCFERFLCRWGFRNLVKPIRAINKSFTSEKTKQREKEQIRAWRLVVQEYEEILQFKLHLLDEKEELKEKRELPGDLTSGQETALDRVNKNLGEIKPKLWKNGQQFVDYSHNGWREAGRFREKQYHFVRSLIERKISVILVLIAARGAVGVVRNLVRHFLVSGVIFLNVGALTVLLSVDVVSDGEDFTILGIYSKDR